MKNQISVLMAALMLLSFDVPALRAQGSLTPSGPPGPAMLTLSQVEPRTPVDAIHTPASSSAEFAISNSGSYYLTTNIVVTSGGVSAVYIATNNVTLDLNGFSLLSPSSVGAYGVYIQSGCTNICVHDGLISGWAQYGIFSGGANVVLDRLTVSGDAGGINLSGAGRCIVRNSIINGNVGSGINCSENNVTFEDLMISSNDPGFNITGVASGVIKDCTVNENVSEGIDCVSATNITIQNLTISHNNGYGMSLSGFQNSSVSDCKVNGNANNTGIYLSGSSCFIIGNSFSGNGISIYVQGANNQIDGNRVNGSNPSAVGIWINNAPGVTNNMVMRNFVTGYGANDYSLGTGQIAGPIITNAVSGIITNSNPWANFSF